MLRRPLTWLDPWLLRGPFEGRRAERYAADDRPAFGELDERVLAALASELAEARVLVDVGAGAGTFAWRAAARHPHLTVLSVEPSAAFSAFPAPGRLRALADALPLADASVDALVFLSVLRHVGDRHAALVEARRVVRPGGLCCVVELDPDAEVERVRAHARGLRSSLSRLTFRPLVLATCPDAATFAQAARRAGWQARWAPDAEQPFYVMRLA